MEISLNIVPSLFCYIKLFLFLYLSFFVILYFWRWNQNLIKKKSSKFSVTSFQLKIMWRNATFQKFNNSNHYTIKKTSNKRFQSTFHPSKKYIQITIKESNLLIIKKHRSIYLHIKEILTNNSNQCPIYKYKKKTQTWKNYIKFQRLKKFQTNLT